MVKNNPIYNKKGVTMTELIVTFALISIFVMLAGQVIASAMGIYHKIQSVEYGKQVSDTIMNKIIGELSGAQDIGYKQIRAPYPGRNGARTNTFAKGISSEKSSHLA